MKEIMDTDETQLIQTAQVTVPDEPEGLDEHEPIDLGDYPIDSLMIRTDKRTAFEVCRRIDSGVYILNPEFQRDFIWDENKQCKYADAFFGGLARSLDSRSGFRRFKSELTRFVSHFSF